MQPKRFFAENSQRAFRLVKESLGSEAVIISNRTLPNGVEVIAGERSLAEESDSPVTPSATEVLKTEEQNPPAPTESSGEQITMPRSTDNLELMKQNRLILGELAAIKIGSWERYDKNRFRLLQYFLSLGFDIKLLARLVTVLDSADSFDQMKRDVLQEIEFSINAAGGLGTAVEELSGIVMLHGMAGVGKSTIVAKIAAQVVASHGSDEVVLVCADNRRMGAYQQLLGYGKILEIPVLQVRRSTELQEILAALSSKRLVLVDHAGITPQTLQNIEQSSGFQCTLSNVKHYLTIAATTQAATLNRLLGAPWKERLDGVIVTKVDEAVQLGELISCLIENHSLAAFMSAGRNIQQDLHKLYGDDLVRRAVELDEQNEMPMDDISDTVKILMHNKLELLH